MAKGKYCSLKYKPATPDRPEMRLYWRNHAAAIEELHSLLQKDVIFLSLDFECTSTSGIHNQIRIQEIGISTFDTRDLASGESIHTNMIKSRHICTQTRDVLSKDLKYLFGESEHVRYRDIMQFIIGKMLYIESNQSTSESCKGSSETTTEKQYRDIVVLCHGGRHDTSILKRIGFDVQDILPIIAIIDTENIGRAVFQTPKGPSLANLLRRLGCPFGALHNAGNDARFTMNVLFALAVKSGMKGSQDQLLQIQQVACAPIRVEKILREKFKRSLELKRASNLNKRVPSCRKDDDWAEMLEHSLLMDGD